MRRNLVPILVFTTFVAVGGAFAAMSNVQTASGTVTSINAAARTISIDTGKAIESFKLDTKALIEQQEPQKLLTLDQLKIGERVAVHYKMMGQDRMASKLQLLPAVHAHNIPAAKQPKTRTK